MPVEMSDGPITLEQARIVLTQAIEEAISHGFTLKQTVTYIPSDKVCCAIGAIGASWGWYNNPGYQSLASLVGILPLQAWSITLGFDDRPFEPDAYGEWYRLGQELANKYLKD